jgi:hypothetical protein
VFTKSVVSNGDIARNQINPSTAQALAMLYKATRLTLPHKHWSMLQ